MQVQKVNNTENSLNFKGKIRYINKAGENIITKTISRADDIRLHNAFLKAAQVESYSYRYGNNFKNSNYFQYLKLLKEITNIDLEETASSDSEKSYDFFHANELWLKQPSYKLSINKDNDSKIEHEFEFMAAEHTGFQSISKKIRKELQNTSYLYKMVQDAEQWAASEPKSSEISKELQMFKMMLELAEYKGTERFNTAEINVLTGLAKTYKSQIPVTDLLKVLLNIGVEKGEPLTAQEMKDFLATTALMNKNEQSKIIEFIKSLKENTFVNSEKDCNDITNKQSEHIHAHTDSSKFVNLKNLEFVFNITKCQKPEIMAVIANKIGITSELGHVPDLFVKIYELSNGNLDLIKDLAKCFYLSEVEQIFSKLLTKNSGNLSKYKSKTTSADYHSYSFSSPDISFSKDLVIQELGLTGQIELHKNDVYRAVRTVDGSFEQGKRR